MGLRTGILVAALAACVAASTASASAAATTYTISGHGYGHGIGLSQYGAQGFAQHGSTAQQIVTYYYQGTTIGQVPATATFVRVELTSGVSKIRVEIDGDGATLQHGADSPVALASGDIVTVTGSANGATASYTRGGKTTPVVATADTQKLVLSGPDGTLKPLLTAENGAANHHYRGSLAIVPTGSTLSLVNDVALESYLLSVVPSEMPSSWLPAALQAQAIAARSYAVADRSSGGNFDLHADTRSQMYLGIEHEAASTTAAVQATAGQVVTYQGSVIVAYFSSTSGGHTASVQEVWGGSPKPYLTGVPDPYEDSPYENWTLAAKTPAQVASEAGYKGTLTGIKVNAYGDGRVQDVVLSGSAGSTTIAGTTFESRFGLRSSWFTVSGQGATSPTPTTAKQVTPKMRGRISAVAQHVPKRSFYRPVIVAGSAAGVAPTAKVYLAVLGSAKGAKWSRIEALKLKKGGIFRVTVRIHTKKPPKRYRLQASNGAIGPSTPIKARR